MIKIKKINIIVYDQYIVKYEVSYYLIYEFIQCINMWS